RVSVRLVITLHADSPVVRCILDVDNQATWHRLRARVPTNLSGVPAVEGAAFGTVARAPVAVHAADYPLETPVATAPAQRFVAALWEDVFLPVRGFWLRDATRLVPASIDIALEGTGLVVSAVKPAQQGSPMVLRCYNATGRKTAGAWRFGEGVKSAHRVRADERESTALVLEGRGKTVRFVAEPYEIVTILVT